MECSHRRRRRVGVRPSGEWPGAPLRVWSGRSLLPLVGNLHHLLVLAVGDLVHREDETVLVLEFVDRLQLLLLAVRADALPGFGVGLAVVGEAPFHHSQVWL